MLEELHVSTTPAFINADSSEVDHPRPNKRLVMLIVFGAALTCGFPDGHYNEAPVGHYARSGD